MNELYHIGIDIHKKFLQISVLNDSGEQMDMRRVSTMDKEFLKRYLSFFPPGTSMVVEATNGWEWLCDMAEECGLEVKLANPHKVRLIAEATIKTDKIDASVLAHLERTDFLPLAYVAPKHIREYRELLRHRMKLIKIRTSLKNNIHSILSRMGIVHEGITDLFGKRGKEFLREVELPQLHRNSVDTYLELIEEIDSRIKEVEKKIKEICETEVKEDAELLMSVPGISYFSALLLLAEIGDITRFSSAKKLCSYAGLVPTTSQTGEKIFFGHLKRDSNKYIKWVLLEAVPHVVKKDERMRQLYEELKGRKGKNKARVAIAQRLCRSIYHMLKKKEKYNPGKIKKKIRFG